MQPIGWKYVGKYEEHFLCDFIHAIQKENRTDMVKKYNQKVICRFIENPALIDLAERLEKDEVPYERVEALLEEANSDELSGYAYEVIHNVLRSKEIDEGNEYSYIKYYGETALNKEDKVRLNSGISFAQEYVKGGLAAIPEDARYILNDELFLSDFLCVPASKPEAYADLKDQKLREVLRILSNYVKDTMWLSEENYQQLKEDPEQIRILLCECLETLGEPQKIRMIQYWLENEKLLFELKKLHNKHSWTTEEREQLGQSKITYVATVYGEDIRMFPDMRKNMNDLLIYAIQNRKKAFLRLCRETPEILNKMPYNSAFADEDFYKSYVNLNSFNRNDLQHCISMKWQCGYKKYMCRNNYTFAEVKTLMGLPSEEYVSLYHFLTYERVDDRLRVIRECGNSEFLISKLSEGDLKKIAGFLSKMPLSRWKEEVFGNIPGVSTKDVCRTFLIWEKIEHFIKEIRDHFQLRYFYKNIEQLEHCKDVKEAKIKMLETDQYWNWLKDFFSISHEFIQENREHILSFLCEGGAEILYEYHKDYEQNAESMRRLLVAELLGRFREVKYHDNDLEKELSWHIPLPVQQIWQESMDKKQGHFHLWEEDRFLPVMQIGEVPESTCLSYKNGMYKKCLLATFDSNKKVLYLSYKQRTVLRAILRLTKGSKAWKEQENYRIQFADLTADAAKDSAEEKLVLFLERAYIKGLPGKEMKNAVPLLLRLLKEKADRLGAIPMISYAYSDMLDYTQLMRTDYYLYISATKGNTQYLDSL
ncbi:hypothetical protein H6B07_15405, partial [Mediterraneibacter glycyrrhizinilyticus]